MNRYDRSYWGFPGTYQISWDRSGHKYGYIFNVFKTNIGLRVKILKVFSNIDKPYGLCKEGEEFQMDASVRWTGDKLTILSRSGLGSCLYE